MIILVLLNLLFVCNLEAQVAPDVEFRGLWIAAVNNMDWPSVPGLNTSYQQQELLDYLQLAIDTHINAIFLHVRPAGDALYDSPIEPWSVYLTGTQGLAPDPYYDPLAFFISEAHRYGIEVHAWINPYRANLQPSWEGLDPQHIAMRYPQYAYPYSTYLWMDPGAQEVLDNVIDVVADIATRYDVDGIHYDDYFYPYPENGQHFPDNATYENYVTSGGNMTWDDWRRDNVDQMVETVYNTVRAISSTIKVSIGPSGSYRPGHPEGMPPPLSGFDPYSEIYADSKKWLQEGWLDLFIPLLYNSIDSANASYADRLDWWLDVNTANKHIYAGVGVYRLSPDELDWQVTEIADQIWLSREAVNRDRGSLGNVLFSGNNFRDNTKGIVEVFQTELYTKNATTPPVVVIVS